MKYEINIIYKRKKHISLRVKEVGFVEVSAPINTSKEKIYSFVKLSEKWIEKRFQELNNKITLEENEYFLLGEKVQCKDNFTKILTETTKKEVERAYNKYVKKLNVTAKSIRLNKSISKFGSCSNRGDLEFSMFLGCYKREAIEYIVVHELCHLVQFNHNKDFYSLVNLILPNYKEQVKYLKKNNYFMREIKKLSKG